MKLAIQRGGENILFNLSTKRVQDQQALPDSLSSPLGSLWKLYVYAWLEDLKRPEQPYQCTGRESEEVYCCHAGESITRDKALIRSCGLYFSPQRLGIDSNEWQKYWQIQQAPAWLQQLPQLLPQTRVSVHEILETLSRLPAQEKARTVLLDVVLNDPKESLAGALGGRLRVKTWSWLADNDANARQGGFAGWLTDGTPLWAGGNGTSITVLNKYASVLNTVLPVPVLTGAGECVVVDLFSRYPIKTVRRSKGNLVTSAGPLRGRYEITFINGNHLELESGGDLYVQRNNGILSLKARLDMEEYVARVLEREAKNEPLEAAKAMAITIRTYLLQSAEKTSNCLSIADSSASQRVLPSPAGIAAKAVAAWTQDLILAGSSVNYHLDRAGEGRLSWQRAVELANNGIRYDAILAEAFPRANLSRWGNPEATCQPLPDAEAWLKFQQPRWRTQLNNEPGYNESAQFAVCRLSAGRPFTDRIQKRLYVRNFFTLQDRLDLTHEYLHLAFDGYPSGLDEQYIENLTRHLLMD